MIETWPRCDHLKTPETIVVSEGRRNKAGYVLRCRRWQRAAGTRYRPQRTAARRQLVFPFMETSA